MFPDFLNNPRHFRPDVVQYAQYQIRKRRVPYDFKRRRLCLCADLFVSLILPVAVLIVFAVKKKNSGVVSAWLLGAAAFFVPQILIRIPLLNALYGNAGFAAFMQNHVISASLFLAFTAGLFELAGRYVAARIMSKNLTFRRSLAAGLGHGGIEAMYIVGIAYLNNLIYISMIRSGTFDAMAAQIAAAGVDVTQLNAVRDALINTSAGVFLLAGLERLLTMISHAAMTVIVCYGVHTKHTAKGLLICLGIHTLIDTAAGIPSMTAKVLPQSAAFAVVYAILFAVAAASVLILKNIRKNWVPAGANPQA